MARRNFGDLPKEFSNYKTSEIVILPVPFEKTSSWLKGSKGGPGAIIKASWHLELYDIETRSEVYKKGIFTEKEVRAGSSASMVKKTWEKTGRLLSDGKFVVTLGGEHSVSLGAVRAHADFFKDLSVLHLDAHTDMRDAFEGSKLSHACVMRRVSEAVENIVSVGIRSMDSSEVAPAGKNKIYYAEEIHDSNAWVKKAAGNLSENVYVTVDVDVFDPGIMPSTGTPEPGGLSWYRVMGLLKAVAKLKNVVGFDVVELCPTANKAPDFLAAKLIYKLLSYKFS